MEILNFVLWLLLVGCGGVGVGRTFADFDNKAVVVIGLVLYVALVGYLAYVLHLLGAG